MVLTSLSGVSCLPRLTGGARSALGPLVSLKAWGTWLTLWPLGANAWPSFWPNISLFSHEACWNTDT